MKQILLILIFCMICMPAYSVDKIEKIEDLIDSNGMTELLTREVVTHCYEFHYNASVLIPQLYERNQYDSIQSVLDFIDEQCGHTLRMTITNTLLNIRQGQFSESEIDSSIIDELIDYRTVPVLFSSRRFWDGLPFQVAKAKHKYDEMIVQLAEESLDSTTENSTEFLLCQFYRGEYDLAVDLLKTDAYQATKLQEYYYSAIENSLNDKQLRRYWAVNAGLWSPDGGLGILGDHPIIGISYGSKTGKYEYDLTLNFRFLNTPNTYTVVEDGLDYSTNKFFGGYIGLNGSFEFATAGHFSWLVLAGLGVDGFDTVNDRPDSPGSHKKSLWSPTGQIGVGWRLYFHEYRTSFITASVRYHLLSYDSDGGSDLSGNAISFGLSVGAFAFGRANERLKRLKYYD